LAESTATATFFSLYPS